jgi:hypothetical protein
VPVCGNVTREPATSSIGCSTRQRVGADKLDAGARLDERRPVEPGRLLAGVHDVQDAERDRLPLTDRKAEAVRDRPRQGKRTRSRGAAPQGERERQTADRERERGGDQGERSAAQNGITTLLPFSS